MQPGEPALSSRREAKMVERGVDPARLVLVEFNSDFCRLLRLRYPRATVVQGDAYRLRRLLDTYVKQPASAIVSPSQRVWSRPTLVSTWTWDGITLVAS